MSPVTDNQEAAVYRYILEHGPITVAAIVDGLGMDAALVSAIIARLLDTHFVIVASVNADAEPLYDAAPSVQ